MTFRSGHFLGDGRLRAAASNAPVMKQGEAGHSVRLVQQALLDLGYKLPVSTAKFGTPDGIYGSETKAVVRKFQIDEKLPAKDGVVGEQTLTRLDALLVAKKIKFRTLPPLPAGASGAFVDDELNAREAIILTFTFNPMRAMHFSVAFDETIDGRHISESVGIFGSKYDRIAQAVVDGTIAVEVHPGLTRLALYLQNVPANLTPAQSAEINALGLSSLPKANTFVFKRAMSSRSLDDQSVIIHEATHAVCDLQARGAMNALFAEMVATVAEAIFRRKKGGAAKTATGIAQKADEIAQDILSGKDPSGRMHDFAVRMRADPAHGRFTHGTYNYDGI